MSDCNHTKIKCMECHRYLDPPFQGPRITWQLHNFLVGLKSLPTYQGWGDMEGEGTNCENNEYINIDVLKTYIAKYGVKYP